MFALAELKDTVRIAPDQFKLNLIEAIRDEINRKLANKVLLNVGLCIALKEIVSLKDSIILPGDGASHTEVVFRYIVFRPAIGNIITGKIRSCSREGVHVTLGFFDDIFIPTTGLQHPSRFEETEQAWVWEYPMIDGSKHDMFMDVGEPIKFRVSSEYFEESSPKGPPKTDQQAAPTTQPKDWKPPYRIVGAINESGLGVVSWWHSHTSPADVEEEGEENEEYNDDDGDGAYEE